jgi:hypothetical protein
MLNEHERRRPRANAPAVLFWLTIFILYLLLSG